MSNILAYLQQDLSTAHLVQCRDIKDEVPLSKIPDLKDTELEEQSIFRPRWGMGGLIAFRRETFDKIGGYDERMRVYGAEDNDFGRRLQRAGTRLNWVDDVSTRIYHIRQEMSSTDTVDETVRNKAIEQNRAIYETDATVFRNVKSVNIGGQSKPAASIIITPGIQAKFLKDAVNSALSQTVQNVEVLINQSSAMSKADRSELADDSRVRFVNQAVKTKTQNEQSLLQQCQSNYILPLSGDDILLPGCLEAHFAALKAGRAGTCGGWMDFDNGTGKMTGHSGVDLTDTNLPYDSKAFYSGASLFRSDVLKGFLPFDETKGGGWQACMLKMLRAGYQINHTGQFQTLRRRAIGEAAEEARQDRILSFQNAVHGKGPLSSADRPSNGDEAPRKLLHCENSSRLVEAYSQFLPDHLTQRSAYIALLSDAETCEIKKLKLEISVDDRFEIIRGEGVPMQKLSKVQSHHFSVLRSIFGTRINFENVAPQSESYDKEKLIWELTERLLQTSHVDLSKVNSVLVSTESSTAVEKQADTVLAYDVANSRYLVSIQASDFATALNVVQAGSQSEANFASFLIYPKWIKS